MKDDNWQTHVRYEIQDATYDKDRLLEITKCLTHMESLDLIPDDIASDLFNLIHIHNSSDL